MNPFIAFFIVTVVVFSQLGCSSSSSSRTPASQRLNRAGRPVSEIRGMNEHKVDLPNLYNSCLKERDASYCNNRLGK